MIEYLKLILPEYTYIGKIVLCILLSSLIGIERETNDKPAGLRTIMLVGLGAALITIFTLQFGLLNNSFDTIRAISYYVASIGFLGSGIIRVGTNNSEGITTASILLPLSVIGFFCGIGEFIPAIMGTLLIYIILNLKYLERKIK